MEYDVDLDGACETGETLAELESEFSTKSIVRVGGEYYYRHANGGSRGSYDRRDGDGVWRDHPVEPAQELALAEARAYLLGWGYSPAEVARLTEAE